MNVHTLLLFSLRQCLSHSAPKNALSSFFSLPSVRHRCDVGSATAPPQTMLVSTVYVWQDCVWHTSLSLRYRHTSPPPITMVWSRSLHIGIRTPPSSYSKFCYAPRWCWHTHTHTAWLKSPVCVVRTAMSSSCFTNLDLCSLPLSFFLVLQLHNHLWRQSLCRTHAHTTQKKYVHINFTRIHNDRCWPTRHPPMSWTGHVRTSWR